MGREVNEIGTYKQSRILRQGEHAKAREHFQDKPRKANIRSLCLKEVPDQAVLICH